MRQQFDLILDSLQNSWFQVAALLPRLVAAVLLLLVGWLLARLVQRLAVRLMRLVRLDAAAEHTGVDDFLVRGGVRLTIVTLVGQILYWGLILIFAVGILMSMSLFGIVLARSLGSARMAAAAGQAAGAVTAVASVALGAYWVFWRV